MSRVRLFGRDWRWGLWTSIGVTVLLIAGLLTVLAPSTKIDDPLMQVRADASTAVRALSKGDLAMLERTLASNRGQTDFAYFFASKATPRAIGDAVATVAGVNKASPFKAGVDTHTYDLVLTDLAGTLALATHGTGTQALPDSWTEDFVEATTTAGGLYSRAGVSSGKSAAQRARQDLANRQNLLLVLSRGYWSTGFLKAVTRAFWDADRAEDGNAWIVAGINDAKYAPAPNGAYLTDGVVALTAALTANPAASRWAFTEFRPGTKTIDGTDDTIGKFSHFLFFDHQFPGSSDSDTGPTGITAALTALSSAIDGTGAGVNIRDALDGDGPTADSIVLQSLATDSADESGGSIFAKTWDATKRVPEALWHWVQHWGHRVLDILSLTPPPFGITAAVTNAVWYSIDGDYADAGLSLATAVPGLAFFKIAKVGKAGAGADKAAREAADVARAADKARSGARVASTRELAEAGAVRIEKSPRPFTSERDAQNTVATEFPGSRIEVPFNPPKCSVSCSGRRLIDVWVPSSKTAIEIKFGINNDAHAVKEIAKEIKLLRARRADIKAIEWRFYPDAKGIVGPSSRIRELLQANDIPYAMYLP